MTKIPHNNDYRESLRGHVHNYLDCKKEKYL